MAKFIQQIGLLTRKNLKIRFSHRCLSFWELCLPLIYALLLGLAINFGGQTRENVDNKAYDTMENATWFDLIHYAEDMEKFTRLNIHYLTAELKDVSSAESELLVENVMRSVFSWNIATENKPLQLNWKRNPMTEKQLEICILQSDPECQGMHGAVIFTKIKNVVQQQNKFLIEYKIRLLHRPDFLGPYLQSDALYLDDSKHHHFLESVEAVEDMNFCNLPSPESEKNCTGDAFVIIQALMDRGIMEYIKSSKADKEFLAQDSQEVLLALVRMPFVVAASDKQIAIATIAVTFSLLFSLLFSLTILSCMQVNSEKWSGFKELLRMHGINSFTQWMAWLLSSLLVNSIWTMVMSLLMSMLGTGEEGLYHTLQLFIILWLVLLLFAMSITTFSYLVSVFFERVWTAACIGLLTWIMITIFTVIYGSVFSSPVMWVIIVGMLMPPAAFSCAFQFLFNGMTTFATMNSPLYENTPLTFTQCLAMMFLDSCIFMGLAMYLDNVLPSKYGVRKPYMYFLWEVRNFVRRRMRGGEASYKKDELNEEVVEMMDDIWRDSQQPFETDPAHAEAAVVIRNLKKIFKWNKKRAVDGLSVTMFTGEIFALLGFNGAGKTTTIGVLSGLTRPSDGDVHIFDFDVRTDMEEIRKHIGLCPQHNLLSNGMSVLEQVEFFGRLKGVKESRTKAEELLKWLDMGDKLHSKPEQLSGGQKRCVQLAVALIGDTKLAFLDEPTSGLDPTSRREVWSKLLKLRGKMTVILTTHEMEEADVLGDRIGIMSEGKMICCGTQSFLKKYYGVGYNLKIKANIPHQSYVEEVHKLTKRFVPNAKLNGVPEGSTAQENIISVSLPTADLTSPQIIALMDALRDLKEEWGIEHIGLSLSTMDEVFLKVGEEVNAVTINSAFSPTSSSAPHPHRDFVSSNLSSSRYFGSKLQWYRFSTLLKKRMLYFFSSPFILVSIMLILSAVLWTLLTGISFIVYIPETAELPKVVSASSLASYQLPVSLLLQDKISGNSSFRTSYLSQVTQNLPSSEIQIKEYPINATFQEIISFLNESQHYLAGASFSKASASPSESTKSSIIQVNGFFSAYALYSAPLSLNLISQTLIKEVTGVDATIEVISHPFHQPRKYEKINPDTPHLSFGKHHKNLTIYGVSMLVVVIMTLLTGTTILLPTEERLNNGKQLQLMTGTTPFTYWMAMFTWDLIFLSVVNLLITACFVMADYSSGNWLFTNNGAGVLLYFILECYLFAALWFSYLVSCSPRIKTASDGFIAINVVGIIVGILWNMVRHIVFASTLSCEILDRQCSYTPYSAFADVLYYFSNLSGYVTGLVPMYSLFQCMQKVIGVSIPNSMCSWFPEEVLYWACKNVTGVFKRGDDWFIHSCCSNCGDKCFQPKSHFSILSAGNTTSLLHGRGENFTLAMDLLLLLLGGVFCSGMIFSMEYLIPFIKLRKLIADSGSEPNPNVSQEDDEVEIEAARVKNIVVRGNDDNTLEEANHSLVAHNLRLKFGKVEAVKGLSFAVHPRECFGLLGVNAAGKTSAFRLLTGDIFPSAGNMYSGGINYYRNRAAYLSSIGYCPQFDAIIGALKGLQMVKLYGALRGIPPERLDEDAKLWLDKFGLLASASKKCAVYSGGMKRRLSGAMAFIGSPKLLLLDEPTTGVDPVFRRQFWNVIREVRESGQSVVMTSHTMDECESLCTRLGIMVNGQFNCLNSPENLRQKYGKGYILTVKLHKSGPEEEGVHEENVKQLVEKIAEEFSPCRPHSKQKFLIQYQILNMSLWYSDIFRNMEQIRSTLNEPGFVEEFSVTEISLENVFLSLANQTTETN